MVGPGRLEGGDILFYAGFTLIVFIALLLVKKIFFRLWLQKNFLLFPSLDINTISSIAMIIATNTAVIFTIIFLTHHLLGIVFQIYPGSRLLIETILIKIGGSLYGPAIGMLIGLLTDLLTVILTSSVFNYGYLLAAIFNGFLGGFIFLFGEKKLKTKFTDLQNTFFVIGLLGITAVACYFFKDSALAEGQSDGWISLNVFSHSLSFPSWFFPVCWAVIGSLFVIFLCLTLFLPSIKPLKKYADKAKKWNVILRLSAINFLAYLLVDIVTLPLFDIKISTLPYEQFFIMRNLFLLPSVLFSSLIIWKIFNLNKKLEFTTVKDRLPLLSREKSPTFNSKNSPRLIY